MIGHANYGDNENEEVFFFLHEPGIVLEEVWEALSKPGGKKTDF